MCLPFSKYTYLVCNVFFYIYVYSIADKNVMNHIVWVPYNHTPSVQYYNSTFTESPVNSKLMESACIKLWANFDSTSSELAWSHSRSAFTTLYCTSPKTLNTGIQVSFRLRSEALDMPIVMNMRQIIAGFFESENCKENTALTHGSSVGLYSWGVKLYGLEYASG